MRFSEVTQAFYDESFEANAAVDDIPTDVREISQEEYQEYFIAVNGACRVYFSNARFVVSPPRPNEFSGWDDAKKTWFMSDEAKAQQLAQYVANANKQRKTLIDEATQRISLLQTKVMMGRALTENEKQTLNAWMDYIDLLNMIDVSGAPNISWPAKPE
ncbi:MAG: tail fiber assembly protein [Pantoea sp. Morm]|uniref:tail fiber assembly protein n=1 Tax=Pantoea sp. Morm TaxID=2601250 RepID=UPI001DF11EBC|nr:tail fiber assembly protein [Pantoea sp. Morm]